MNWFIYLIPFLSALLGWLFNKLCGRYILKTYIPQQKEKIINQLTEKLQTILPLKNIEAQLSKPELIEKAMPMIESHIDEFLTEKLPKEIPMLAMFVGNKTTDKIKEVFMNQLKSLFPKVMTEIVDNTKKTLDIKNFLKKELDKQSFQTDINNALANPLKKLYLAGAVSGFLIGVINLLLFMLLN